MATRPIIVLGHRPDGSLQAIYAGGDGGEAEAAFEAAGAPDFVRVEEIRFPPVSRRRDFEVPDSGTAEAKTEKPAKEPKAPKPKKPSKAELKKAEKEAKEAEAAAQESETATEDDKPEF